MPGSTPTVVLRVIGAMLALVALRAEAAPDPGDRIATFLSERGLIETPAPTPPATEARGLVTRLREQADTATDWASDLVISAMNFLGVRYRRGGDSAAEGFDCSGFTRHVFESSIGLVLPRRSNEQAQAAALKPVARSELRPGDLVFFNTLRAAFSHVGIYIGDGKFIHSPRSGSAVRVEDMRAAYWTRRYDGARRAAPPAEPGAVTAPALQPTALPAAEASPTAL
ncbi:MAG TPA: C40 family peptidase [Methylibium sp.]|nr:C40 family peptidase [Methylibium sp.]